jgi:hypothetical protein
MQTLGDTEESLIASLEGFNTFKYRYEIYQFIASVSLLQLLDVRVSVSDDKLTDCNANRMVCVQAGV